jgi:putative lipoic acid-binding regulatory protein
MTDRTTLIEFPCRFSIKIIGFSSTTFVSDITAIIKKHYPKTKASDIQEKRSKHNNYVSITATVKATNQETLDALYQELTHFPGVKMVL